MLIRNAQINCDAQADVRIASGRITEIGSGLAAQHGEVLIDARGAALLPGLRDHHLHLYALAAAQASVPCGPPQVHNAKELAHNLRVAASRLTTGTWLRGTAYHESVAGEIDRDGLDTVVAEHPLRIQHRSGRLWILNSRALELVMADGASDTPLERIDGRVTGRLYDADGWLRTRIGGVRPDLSVVSRELAGRGVTGVTDTSHHNGSDAFQSFVDARARGELLQEVCIMGGAELDEVTDTAGVRRGAHKFHLHENDLPDFDGLCAQIRRAHRAGRGVAFHCVTRTDLVFALSALREAGSVAGDRIEHAAIVPPELLAQIKALGLTVVTQPNFIAERGDAYLRDVAVDDQAWLYRLRGFLDAGVPLAAGSDAPYGDIDPWAAMQAAVTRRTRDGQCIGAIEALTPEQALALFTTDLSAPGGTPCRIEVNAPADLCLLDSGWQTARSDLSRVCVRLTLRCGVEIWRADESQLTPPVARPE